MNLLEISDFHIIKQFSNVEPLKNSRVTLTELERTRKNQHWVLAFKQQQLN